MRKAVLALPSLPSRRALPFMLRRPELVSGSIVPQERAARAEKWTLKQVQGDDCARGANTSFAKVGDRTASLNFLNLVGVSQSSSQRKLGSHFSLLLQKKGDSSFLWNDAGKII
jgi:hypothetical protein